MAWGLARIAGRKRRGGELGGSGFGESPGPGTANAALVFGALGHPVADGASAGGDWR